MIFVVYYFSVALPLQINRALHIFIYILVLKKEWKMRERSLAHSLWLWDNLVLRNHISTTKLN